MGYRAPGGRAVDLRAGRETRAHADLDVAPFRANLERVAALLTKANRVHHPEPGKDVYTGYNKGRSGWPWPSSPRDAMGVTYTPSLTDDGSSRRSPSVEIEPTSATATCGRTSPSIACRK